jgi:hypothetical protein
MEFQQERKKEKMFVAIDNLDKYDITDCLDILRYIQTFDREDLQTEDFKKFIYKLECRIKFLVLHINQ